MPASTSLKLVATTLGSSWNCAVWKLSSEVVVRAASASPAGEEKLRLHVVASAQGAARARDVRARHNIEHEKDARHELLSTRVLRRTKSFSQLEALLRPAVSSAEVLLRLLLVGGGHY